jgi:hypothetical protein
MLRKAKVEQAGVFIVVHAENAPLAQHPGPIVGKRWQQPTLRRIRPVDVAGTAVGRLDEHLRSLASWRIDSANVHNITGVFARHVDGVIASGASALRMQQDPGCGHRRMSVPHRWITAVSAFVQRQLHLDRSISV